MVGVRGFEPPTPSSRTMCATRLRYTPTWQAPRRPASWPYRGAGHAAQASHLRVASRLRRTARRLCYLTDRGLGSSYGSDRIGRRKGKRRPAALRATRSRGSRMTFRLKPLALAAALIASVCQAAATISRARAHLLPDGRLRAYAKHRRPAIGSGSNTPPRGRGRSTGAS
jgi:hypothetical protein